jgi:hypothetical protein
LLGVNIYEKRQDILPFFDFDNYNYSTTSNWKTQPFLRLGEDPGKSAL